MNPHLRTLLATVSAMLLAFSAFAEGRNTLVSVSGEVVFPGQYILNNDHTTASDIISDAGGLTADAYLAGIALMRGLTDEEYSKMLLACRLAEEQLAGLDVTLQVPSRDSKYPIGYEETLRDGDEIIVPKLHSTVKVSGAVNFPTVVTFDPEASIDDYLRMAGGFAGNADRSRMYILSPSGEKMKRNKAKLLPGSEICVPASSKSGGKMIFAEEILSICTSTSSVTAMVLELVGRISD